MSINQAEKPGEGSEEGHCPFLVRITACFHGADMEVQGDRAVPPEDLIMLYRALVERLEGEIKEIGARIVKRGKEGTNES